MKKAAAESLAVGVYQELRRGILTGGLEPGRRLKPSQLSRDMGVSLGVVREAMGLLAAKGLVRIDRNRGFNVMTLSADHLAELTFARVVNEGAALRLSVTQGDLTWESEVLAAHHRLAALPILLPGVAAAMNPEWASAHSEFHRKLIDRCANEVLLDICDRLSDASDIYRAWSATKGRERGRDVVAEHRALCEAAVSHDADLAVLLFERHVRRTQSLLTSPPAGASGAGGSSADGQPGHAEAATG